MLIVSPALPVAGDIVMPGLGMVNEVVPEMFETVALMTREPGTKDPPAAAAGTAMVTVKLPEVSVAGAGIGRALAVPKVMAERLVWLGKLLPVIVTRVPVEPEVGDTVTVPAVIDRVFVFVLFAVNPLVPAAPLLSVAVMVMVSTLAATGMVTDPVNSPVAVIGNGPDVTLKAPVTEPLIESVTWELTPPLVFLPNPAPVTVMIEPGPPVLGLRAKLRDWMLKPDDVPTK